MEIKNNISIWIQSGLPFYLMASYFYSFHFDTVPVAFPYGINTDLKVKSRDVTEVKRLQNRYARGSY